MSTQLKIERALESAGWKLQSSQDARHSPGYGIAQKRTDETSEDGRSYFVLHVAGQPLGVLRTVDYFAATEEMNSESTRGTAPGSSLQDEEQTPGGVWGAKPKPRERRAGPRAVFMYETDGYTLRFTDEREATPTPRTLSHIHRPAALAAFAGGSAVPLASDSTAPMLPPEDSAPAKTLIQRLEDVPMVAERALWNGERLVLSAVEAALRRGDRRVLAQMAHGAGKTYTLLNLAQRVLQFAGLHRVLLLVDNDPLAYQTTEEWKELKPLPLLSITGTPLPPDVYPDLAPLHVQQLTDAPLSESARLVVASPQRILNSMGVTTEPLSVTATLHAGIGQTAERAAESRAISDDALPIHPSIPPETFDLVLCDDPAAASMRVLKPLLRYFDAPLVALVSAPGRELLRFFGQPVAEYPNEQAIADNAVLAYDAYRVRVEPDLQVQAGLLEISKQPQYLPRAERWAEQPDSFDLHELLSASDQPAPGASDLAVLEAFRDRLTLDMYPTRALVPKTLIIARDEAHAEELVLRVRDVFNRGSQFCKNLSRSGGSDDSVEGRQLGDEGDSGSYLVDSHYADLSSFRTAEYPRIGVVSAFSFVCTTDLRPAEIVLLLAPVQSRSHFELLKACVTRTMKRADFLKVTRDGDQSAGKTHGLLIDAVGLMDIPEPSETLPLDRRPTVSTAQLVQDVAFANNSPEVLYTLAARLLRLDCKLSPSERDQVAKASGGATLHTLAGRLISALDTDRQLAHAERTYRSAGKLNDKAIQHAGASLLQQSIARLHGSAELRNLIVQLDRHHNSAKFRPGVREADEEAPAPG